MSITRESWRSHPMDTFSSIRDLFDIEITRRRFVDISSLMKGESTWKRWNRSDMDTWRRFGFQNRWNIVLIKTNIFVLVIRLQDVFKTSWSRPINSLWSYVFKMSSRLLSNEKTCSCLHKSIIDITVALLNIGWLVYFWEWTTFLGSFEFNINRLRNIFNSLQQLIFN